jgi:hypothetical protein
MADSRDECIEAITTKAAPTKLRRAFSFEKVADETLPVVVGNDTAKQQQFLSQDKSTLTKTFKAEKATEISKMNSEN